MLKKRLIGVVTVKDGWAVQSFGYRRYLPLGKPERLVENLDRWGADEILVQCISRSRNQAGPDFALLERLGAIGLGTPLIYAGGITNVSDGVKAIQCGADRIALDSLLHDAPGMLHELGQQLGLQALIAVAPVKTSPNGLLWHNYRDRRDFPLSCLDRLLKRRIASELLIIDYDHEGQPAGFDSSIIDALPDWEMPILAFGGISEIGQMRDLLARPSVAAVGVGNFLNYRELAIQQYKEALSSIDLRPALYATDLPHTTL